MKAIIYTNNYRCMDAHTNKGSHTFIQTPCLYKNKDMHILKNEVGL